MVFKENVVHLHVSGVLCFYIIHIIMERNIVLDISVSVKISFYMHLFLPKLPLLFKGFCEIENVFCHTIFCQVIQSFHFQHDRVCHGKGDIKIL